MAYATYAPQHAYKSSTAPHSPVQRQATLWALHWDYIEREEIHIQYIQTNDMLANSLTKPLDRVKFEQMIKELGLQNW